MAFSDLQIKVASEEAIMGLNRHVGSLKYFAKNLSPKDDRPFAAVTVPVYALSAAAEFDEDSNSWCGGSNEVGGKAINLSKHFIKSIGLDDVSLGSTDINVLRDGAKAIADVLGTATEKYVYGLINETNVSAEAEFDGSSLSAFANLFAIADTNGVDPYECVLALNPTQYAKLMSNLPANVYATDDAIKSGIVPGVFGFRAALCTPFLNQDNSDTIGVIIPYNTLGIVSRVNKPAIDGYVNTWTVTADDGYSIGFRVFEHLCKGKMYIGADVLVGAEIVQNGIVRLVTPAS